MYRVVFATVISFGLLIIAGRGEILSQDKKEKKTPDQKESVIATTDKAPGHWVLKEAKVGEKIVSDRDHLISDLPEEMIGTTFLLRSEGDFKTWLKDASIIAKKKTTVYVMITKGKGRKNEELFTEADQAAIKKDGWTEVEGKASNAMTGDCRVYKMDIKEGLVFLKLEHLTWNPRKYTAFFFFK